MAKFETEYHVETPGLLSDPITAYLEQHDKRVDEHVLAETVRRMRQVIVKDLMTPRDSRPGRESCTSYTGACARKSRLTFDGAERDPLRARTLLKFLLGDLVELSVLALARLAGCHIEDNNIDLTITGEDSKLVPVHPDGRYVDPNGQSYNVEIKSCDSRTFDGWLANGGPDDTWGILTQGSIEIKAWREAGVPVLNTIFLAVSTGSRQGSLAEWIVPYDEQLVIGWHERRVLAQQDAIPEIPFEGQPEMAYMRGKAVNADWFAHGEPIPRTNEKGAIYGWDTHTGRTLVPMVCTYCDFRSRHCWQQAVLEMDGTKPAWVVPDPRTAAPQGSKTPSVALAEGTATLKAPQHTILPLPVPNTEAEAHAAGEAALIQYTAQQRAQNPLTLEEACYLLNESQSVKELAGVANDSLRSEWTPSERQTFNATKTVARQRLAPQKARAT